MKTFRVVFTNDAELLTKADTVAHVDGLGTGGFFHFRQAGEPEPTCIIPAANVLYVQSVSPGK